MDIKEAKEILGNEISFMFDFINPIVQNLNILKVIFIILNLFCVYYFVCIILYGIMVSS